MTKKILLLPLFALVAAGCSMPGNDATTSPTPSPLSDSAMMQNGDTTVPLNADGGVMVGGAMMTPERTIVENAMNANNLTTVVAAVDAAGLVDTLNGPGPFTVFAPTNAAFDALPAGTVDTLLLPANKARLTNILTYHVVPGRYMAADLTDGMKLTTVQGDELMFGMKNGKMTINGEAMVEVADIVSSNGISHVIDTVLMPK